MLIDFYDIPKRIQRSAASGFASDSEEAPVKQEMSSKGKYDHIKSKLMVGSSTPIEVEKKTPLPQMVTKDTSDTSALKSSTSNLIKKMKDSREKPPRARRKIEMPLKESFPVVQKAEIEREESAAIQAMRTLGEDYIGEKIEPSREDVAKDSFGFESELSQVQRPLSYPPFKMTSHSSSTENPSTSSFVPYNKSRYQSRGSPLVLGGPLALDPRPDLEERIKKLEERVEEKIEVKSAAATTASVTAVEERIDSETQTQTDFSAHVEQSVQTSPIHVQTEEEIDSQEPDTSEEQETEPEESRFEDVHDLAIEEFVPESSGLPRTPETSLNIDGEKDEVPVLEERVITMKELQTQFKQEISLDNVVEEIIGRMLSEELERDLLQSNDSSITPDDITGLVHSEISKLYRSAQTAAEESVKYTDEFNEMFLAHALLASLTQKPKDSASDEERSIENLEFTESPDSQGAPQKSSPRSAWEAKGSREQASTGKVAPSSARSVRSVTSTRTDSLKLAGEEANTPEDSNSPEDSSDTSPPYYTVRKGSTDSSSSGMATPPTPATPRSFDDVISSVEAKLKVFEGPSKHSASKSESTSVVRKLDLSEDSSSSSS